MMGKCKFRNDWMLKEDMNGQTISSWASKQNETEGFCKICDCTIYFANKGIHAFFQHSLTDKHKVNIKNMQNQMVLVAGSQSNLIQNTDNNLNSNTKQVKLHCSRNAATISELIWVMKSICCNFSAASCSNIKDTFEAMFPEAVPKEFSLSPKKMNYLITDALAPYFYEAVTNDIGTSFYTICFDETTNVEDKKELLITIRYWSESRGEIITRHLQTCFLGKADADILYDKINCAIKQAKLSLKNLLMIGSDGPNVNKKVHMLFDENLIELRSFGLVDIGTCPIHSVHNAYLKALQAFGEDASELAVAIFHYFDGWPARWEDYEKIQEELQLPLRRFVKHSPSRWLTFHSSAKRLLEQWEGIIYYFQKFIPIKKNKTVQSSSFRKISDLIRKPAIKAEIYFTMSSAELFMAFTETFQSDEPLVHVLFLKLKELVDKLARRVCKQVSNSYDELFHSENILAFKDIVVSQNVKEELAHLSERDSIIFMRNVKDHYVTGCSYLIKKCIDKSDLIKSLRFLNPSQIRNKKSCRDIISLVKKMPITIKEDTLMDEFKILQLEELPTEETRVDHFWQNILKRENIMGHKKFIELGKIVKAALTLSHGNADIERRFSVSKRILTDGKASTSERTLNAILIVKDALKIYSNKPELVSMTSKLISMGQNAHKYYIMHIEEEKRLKEIEEKKKEEEIRLAAEVKEKMEKAEESRKRIGQIEDKINKSEKEREIASEASDRLLKEANDRLKTALQKGDLHEISIAQGMLEGILSMRKTEQQKLKEVRNLQKTVQKRKNNLITTFFKKPKTN